MIGGRCEKQEGPFNTYGCSENIIIYSIVWSVLYWIEATIWDVIEKTSAMSNSKDRCRSPCFVKTGHSRAGSRKGKREIEKRKTEN